MPTAWIYRENEQKSAMAGSICRNAYGNWPLMRINYRQQVPFLTLCYTLLVMGFCFLPHVFATPWWLSFLALVAVSYQATAHYYYFPILPRWLRLILVMLLLALLKWQYGSFFSSGFFIGALTSFFWLKIIEIQTLRDIKVVIMTSFYIIFTALVLHAKLWILLYLIASISAILFLSLKLVLPSISAGQLARQSLKYLLIVLPITILMFFLFPRVNPLWHVTPPSQGHTAFKEEMSPGSLSSLAPDESTVMRITFKNPKATPALYWYGLILDYYDGAGWKQSKKNNVFFPLALLPSKQEAEYEILLEPHEKKWLFYLKNPGEGWPKLMFSSSVGLMRWNGEPVTRRFSYGLTSQKNQAIYLSPVEKQQNLQLPAHANPRLKQWAEDRKRQFQGSNTQFVQQILHHIQQKPFWYRLNPKPVGHGSDQLDLFWFETREGYCEHYASAVTFILRSAGIPARVVLGYHGGEWNPFGQYLLVRQKDAHAWLEYWQENHGWKRIDPTSYIARERIDQSILEENTREQAFYSNWSQYRLQLPWLARARLTMDSIRFFWERWLLFYNHDRQQVLMKTLGLGSWSWTKLFLYWIGSLLLFLLLLWAGYYWRQKTVDPLTREYQRFQQELRKFNIAQNPPLTLAQQLGELANQKPKLKAFITRFLAQYEHLRLQKNEQEDSVARHETYRLIKSLRARIKKE